jgi:hypothetical protein
VRDRNDFGKKAEKMAKEEKETKKTVSTYIKKDLYVMTGKTPIVKIDDEVSLEDDDFSQ